MLKNRHNRNTEIQFKSAEKYNPLNKSDYRVIYLFIYLFIISSGSQWLSGRVLDSRPKGRGFEPHRHHCAVSLSKNINPSLVLVQPRKTRSFITERLLMGRKESNRTRYDLISAISSLTGLLIDRLNHQPCLAYSSLTLLFPKKRAIPPNQTN